MKSFLFFLCDYSSLSTVADFRARTQDDVQKQIEQSRD